MGITKKEVKINLTEDHVFTFDSAQFILKTRTSRKGDVIPAYFNDDGKEISEKVIKNDNWDSTFHPTITNLLKSIAFDEVKSVVSENYQMLKEIGDKFDTMLSKPYRDRGVVATMWFERFIWANDDLLVELKKEVRDLKRKLSRYEENVDLAEEEEECKE